MLIFLTTARQDNLTKDCNGANDCHIHYFSPYQLLSLVVNYFPQSLRLDVHDLFDYYHSQQGFELLSPQPDSLLLIFYGTSFLF